MSSWNFLPYYVKKSLSFGENVIVELNGVFHFLKDYILYSRVRKKKNHFELSDEGVILYDIKSIRLKVSNYAHWII